MRAPAIVDSQRLLPPPTDVAAGVEDNTPEEKIQGVKPLIEEAPEQEVGVFDSIPAMAENSARNPDFAEHSARNPDLAENSARNPDFTAMKATVSDSFEQKVWPAAVIHAKIHVDNDGMALEGCDLLDHCYVETCRSAVARLEPAGYAEAVDDDLRVNEQGAGVPDAGTTIVDNKSVMASIGAQREKWKLAAEEELIANFQSKGVYRLATPTERAAHGAPIPMKCVWAQKRADSQGNRRHRCRAVACGNLQAQRPDLAVFTAQIDAAALLMMLRLASWNRWSILSMDISAAFLNAPLDEAEDLVIVRPHQHGLLWAWSTRPSVGRCSVPCTACADPLVCGGPTEMRSLGR